MLSTVVENQGREQLSLMLPCLLHAAPVHVSGCSVWWRAPGLEPPNAESLKKQLPSPILEELMVWL